MELKQLEFFLKVSQYCNFTKAAQELNYAQSHVSAQIKKLEEELGCSLFDRIGHKVALTKKGVELIPYAQQMLSLSSCIHHQVGDTPSGRLILTASEFLCTYVLPDLLNTYHLRYPNTELHLSMLETCSYESILSQSETDLAFLIDQPLTDSCLQIHYDQELSLHLFTVPDHPLASMQLLTVEQLHHQPFILTKPDCCYRKQFETQINQTPLQIIMETSSIQTIKEMTLKGLGICLLPDLAVCRELEQGLLVKLPLNLEFSIHSQLVSHPSKWLSPEAKQFIELLQK